MLAKLSIQTKLYLAISLTTVVVAGLVLLGYYNRSNTVTPSSTTTFGGATIEQDPRTSPDNALASGSGIYITNGDLLANYLSSGQLVSVESQMKRLIYNQDTVIVTLATIPGSVAKQANGDLKFNLLASNNSRLYSMTITSDDQGVLTVRLDN